MIQSCKAAADLTPAARRRLLADLKRLQEEPVPLAAAQPCDDKDLTLWDGVIGAEMEVTHIGRVTVPLHFLIDFPQDYPQSAPNIGFSFEFVYRGGAEYTMPDGRLRGKKVICLDVLGNFGKIHSEWKNSIGSGWTPAYTVTTLLVQLQSVLCDLGNSMTQSERDRTYQSAVRFCEKNPAAVLELCDEEELRDRREQRRLASQVHRICQGNEALVARVQSFVRKAGFSENAAHLEAFLGLLTDVAAQGNKGASSCTTAGSSAGASGSASSSECGESSARAPAVDTNICCFATGQLYTEALLGVGVSRERRNLGTAAELLSLEAYNGGLRQNTNKAPFEFFLPVWINEAHAAGRPAWREALRRSYLDMGSKVFETKDEDGAIIEVFPRLINQMIVEVMKPDAGKSAAIATFEAMCNFWRTLRWLVDGRASLRNRLRALLQAFVADEANRHKDVTPDLGVVLVLFTAFQGHEGCPSRQAFITAYVDENSLRQVMWWQRSNTKPEPAPVFQATQVSREICMFQMMVVDLIIGDVAETLGEIEATNCKLPVRLEKLQVQWRECKASIGDWAAFFKCVGAPRPAFGSVGEWIANCVRRAAAKGPKYGGAKGAGKGQADAGKGGKGGKGADGKGKGGGRRQ